MNKHDEELCKNPKPATRGYVFETGKFYWNLTKERIASEVEPLQKRLKMITTLAVTGAVIGLTALVLALLAYLK